MFRPGHVNDSRRHEGRPLVQNTRLEQTLPATCDKLFLRLDNLQGSIGGHQRAHEWLRIITP